MEQVEREYGEEVHEEPGAYVLTGNLPPADDDLLCLVVHNCREKCQDHVYEELGVDHGVDYHPFLVFLRVESQSEGHDDADNEQKEDDIEVPDDLGSLLRQDDAPDVATSSWHA